MKNITYIIPLHELREGYLDLLDRCLDSIYSDDNERNVILSLADDIADEVKNHVKKDVVIATSKKSSTIQTLLSLGIKNSKTEYIAYVEFDDFLNRSFERIAELHIEDNIDMLLPLACKVDSKNNTTMGYINEFYWSALYSTADNRQGVLDTESFEKFKDMPMVFMHTLFSGAVVRKSIFDNVGYFKDNMPYNFFIEFIMRVAYKGYDVRIANEFNYIHTVNRSFSFDVLNKVANVGEKQIINFIEKLESEYRKTDKANK